jgi:hypothetical protein
MTRNLSRDNPGSWKSGCRTTLTVTVAEGTNMPVLGLTLNFSGEVVLIWEVILTEIKISSYVTEHNVKGKPVGI